MSSSEANNSSNTCSACRVSASKDMSAPSKADSRCRPSTPKPSNSHDASRSCFWTTGS